jgi:FtsZ-interacting cell division protein ZipA
MPGLYATVVGGVVIVALILVGIWLTWLSLRDQSHRPAALQTPEPDDTE